jgi:hypothetical protein
MRLRQTQKNSVPLYYNYYSNNYRIMIHDSWTRTWSSHARNHLESPDAVGRISSSRRSGHDQQPERRPIINLDSGGGRRSHGSPVHPVEGRRRGPEPRSVRIQSRLRLRPAMRPTARTRSWPAHCSGQRGPKPQRSKAARLYEAPSEPRPTASKRRPVRPPRTRGTRARRDGSHSVDRHADSE